MSTLESDLLPPPSGSASTTDLARRVRRIEDERQILQLIDLHGMLSDAGPAEGFADLYAEDCYVDLGELMLTKFEARLEHRDDAETGWEPRFDKRIRPLVWQVGGRRRKA